jgi:predicted DsbA family dithiol-disulfide isomerase
MSASITITEYTDPGCPFAWSAEPARRRVDWLYGDQLRWELRMVGLSDDGAAVERAGFTPERQSAAFKHLAEAHGMPIDTSVRARTAATMPACRAVVATRLNAPESERAFLRAIRVLHFSGELLDDPQTLDRAARDAGLDPADLELWSASPTTNEALAEDLQLSRDPSPGALALAHKLASSGDGNGNGSGSSGYRYTCPSYELHRESDGASLSAPGFQPAASYEVAIANLAPSLTRRPDPTDVTEVLQWAGEPLATAEVAAVCGIDREQAREQLGRVATEHHIGFDGLWSL